MSGPVANFGARDVAREAAQQDEGPQGWEWFKEQFGPALAADPFRPGDDVLEELARYGRTELGAKVLAWLHGLTDAAPYPAGNFKSFEEAAIAAAKHAGRAGVGHVLTRAVAEGQRLRDAHNKG